MLPPVVIVFLLKTLSMLSALITTVQMSVFTMVRVCPVTTLLGRQSQPYRRHCWRLQDQPFGFWGRFGPACILWTRLSTSNSSVCSCVPSSWNENWHDKHQGIISLYNSKPVLTEKYAEIGCGRSRSSSKGSIHEWRKTK